jgi:hypothetical protein
VSTLLSSLSVTVAVSVAIAVLVVPFLVDCCISPTAIAVSAVVFVASPLPPLLPSPLLPPSHLPSL